MDWLHTEFRREKLFGMTAATIIEVSVIIFSVHDIT